MNTSLKVQQCDLLRCSLRRLGERLYDGICKLKQVLQYGQNSHQIKLGNGNSTSLSRLVLSSRSTSSEPVGALQPVPPLPICSMRCLAHQ